MVLLSCGSDLQETVMDRETFEAWLAEADGLSPRQREDAVRVLAEPASLVALLEARLDEARRCPHCSIEGAVLRGRSNGLRRYCCKGCGKTFNALTGTPLARLRKKELWAAFAEGLGEGDTVAGAAARCGVAGSTSFRWRHRFLAAVKAGSIELKGIVEADIPTSRKAARKLDRKPRKRGGVAKQRGLSKEQVPRRGSQPHALHARAARPHGRNDQAPSRNRDRARRAAGHQRRSVLSALCPSPGHQPRAARPQGR
jgi:transposase-like protein